MIFRDNLETVQNMEATPGSPDANPQKFHPEG